MNLRNLYTTFDGRISRKPFWIGAIGLFAVGIIVSVIVTLPLTAVNPTLGNSASLLISLAFLYPASALGVKRLHDRGKSGRLMAVFMAPGIIYQAAELLGVATQQTTIDGQAFSTPTVIGMALGLLSLIVAIWALVALGIRQGNSGSNRYGPDPLETTQASSAA